MIKHVITALSLSLCLAGAAHADSRMADCNKQATGMKGDERKAAMKACLSKSSAPAAAATPAPAMPATPAVPAAPALSKQQNKMADCNKQATGMKGDERKAAMKSCLSGAAPAAAVSAPAPVSVPSKPAATTPMTGKVDKNGKALTAQQMKMGECSKQGKGRTGADYKQFVSQCLKK